MAAAHLITGGYSTGGSLPTSIANVVLRGYTSGEAAASIAAIALADRRLGISLSDQSLGISMTNHRTGA